MTDLPTNSIFQEAWWLNAVAPERWGKVEIRANNETKAWMPISDTTGRFGIKGLGMPPLTQTLGPWLAPSQAKYANRLAEEKDLIFALVEQLPRYDFFVQNLHYSITNWLPFCWKGFSDTTRYTYVIENLNDIDAVWSGFHAEDAAGTIHAAAFMIWDKRSAYYLLSGADPRLRNSGAGSLVLWEAIRFASTVTRLFDFEGSVMEPIERHFRAYGGIQKRYFQISKINSKILRAVDGIKLFIRR